MNIKKLLFCLLLLTSFSNAFAQQPEAATAILDKAYKQAKKENKKVFVMFHASWCGWCKKMDNNMNSIALKNYFDQNYVVAHLTVTESPKNKNLENPGGDLVLKQFNAEKAGLPFFVILDANGKLLEDSFNAKGENLGCPSSPEEVTEFTAMLKKTSKLKDAELAQIAEVFIIKKK